MKVIAHRGYSGKYPENTMLAFQKAVEAGCDEIELDVHVTKDGQVVVSHDEVLGRAVDGEGAIKDHTWEELKRMNAAKQFPQLTEFERIPLFEEYCEWAAGQKITTNVELKTGSYYYEELEEKTAQIVKRYGLQTRMMFSSFNHVSLLRMKQLLAECECGALMGHFGMGNAGYYCNRYGFECYHPEHTGVTDEVLESCRRYAIKINAWIVNDMDALQKAYEKGYAGVITNYPLECREWLSKKE